MRTVVSGTLALIALIATAACQESTAPVGAASEVTVRAYVDADGSGSFTAGDVPIGGAPITLTSTQGGPTLTATTDAEGRARFTDVPVGSYLVAFGGTAPAGAELATASTPVVVAPHEGGTREAEFRFVFHPGSVRGVVFRDDGGTGEFQPEIDTPAPGVAVALYRGTEAAGTPLATTVTDAGGVFVFPRLRPGQYTIRITPLPGIEIVGETDRQVTVEPTQRTDVAVLFTGNLLITIAEARALEVGTGLTIEGVVTAGQGTYRSDNLQMQDPTAGILVFGVPTDAGFQVGDSIRVSGQLGAFRGQLQVVQPAVERLGTGTVPTPRIVTGQQVRDRTFEGELATAPNVTVVSVSGSATSTAYNVTVADPSGTEFTVRVAGSGVGIPQTFWDVNVTYNVTGVLASFDGQAQLQPRSVEDVERVAEEDHAISIAAAKELTVGDSLVVRGVVTVGQGTFRSDNLQMQDTTSGILVFGVPAGSGFAVGDSVRVRGTLGAFRGQLQIVTPTVELLGTGTVPAPRLLRGDQINARTFEGELVRVENVEVVSIGSGTTAYNVTVRDPAGTQFTVRVSGSGVGIDRASWTVGARYDIVGALGSFDGTAQLLPRGPQDVSQR